MNKPDGLSFIFLIEHATLEVCGVERDLKKALNVPGLLLKRRGATSDRINLFDATCEAVLESYGIEMNDDEREELGKLLQAVADGERTFIDSDWEQNAAKLRKNGEAEGIDMQKLSHETRMGERNAARIVCGLPLLEG